MNRKELLDIVRGYIDEHEKVSNDTVVPVSGANIDTNDLVNVIDTVLDGWFTESQKSIIFSQKLKSYFGINYVQLVNSGSSANLLALLAASDHIDKAGSPQFVVTCATGFPTTVAPIYQAGFFPYFVDIDPKTLNADAKKVILALQNPDVVGVMLAHTLGFPFDAEFIEKACQQMGKFFVNDCCDAFGAKISGLSVTSYGDISTLSFFPAHHITTGEGGAILTRNKVIHSVAKSIANWGRDCYCRPGQDNSCGKRFEQQFGDLPFGYDHKYVFTRLGYNMKMTELQAALGASQMTRIQQFIDSRILNYLYLNENFHNAFDDNSLIYGGVDVPEWAEPSPFGFPITVLGGMKNKCVEYLESKGIRTRPVFAGNITKQPMLTGRLYLGTQAPGSDFVMNNVFWVGVHPNLSIPQLERVVTACKEFEKEYLNV